MQRKQISLKRLYMMASNYLVKSVNAEKDFARAKREMHIIRLYLKYVAEHKDDEL